jgi:outer membrane lipoprotein-sorting protein
MSQPPIDPDGLLDAVIERLRQQDVPPMPESLIGPAIHPARRNGAARFPRTLRTWIMQRPLQISATVLAIAVVVLFLAVGPFGHSDSFAFGDVQKAIGATKSTMYQCLIFNGGDDPIVIKVWCLGPDRSRSENSDGEVQILNVKEEAMMRVSRVNRTALIESLYPSPEIPKMLADSLARFRGLPEKASRRIEEREYKGRKVIDFLVKLDDRNYTVTVDAETKLPVRMEFATEKLAGTGPAHRELYTDFVFDAPLDESLFALTPPPGYRVERRPLPRTEPVARDDNSLVVSPETGIGPAQFGMTQEQIVQALGKPDRYATTESTMPPQTRTGRFSKPQTYVSTELDYGSRGFQLRVSSKFRIGGSEYPGYGLLSIRVFNQVDQLPTVRDFQGRTREGIRLGATPDDVLKVYGVPDSKIENGGLSYLKLGWSFEFRHGKLAAINVNSPYPADTLRSGRVYVKQSVPAVRK